MSRFDIFFKNFKWVYVNFHGSYDINNDPELFRDTVKAYLEMSNQLPTDKIYDFCRFVAQHEKMPSMSKWYDILSEFTRKPEPQTTKKKKTEKEKGEGQLSYEIIRGLWPLFATLEGRCAVARLYAYVCYKNDYTLPAYWKRHLVYTPMPELKADYFDMKPFTKKEMRLMGAKIDMNNRDSNGKPVLIGKKLGSIVGGFLVLDNKRRKY